MNQDAKQFTTENGYRLRVFENQWQWFGPDTDTLLDRGRRADVAFAINYYISVFEQEAATAALTQ